MGRWEVWGFPHENASGSEAEDIHELYTEGMSRTAAPPRHVSARVVMDWMERRKST